MFRTGGLLSFANKGWLRHKENSPVPLSAQTGWLFKPPIIQNRTNKRWLETTTPSAPFNGCFAAFFFMSRPPLLRKGGEFATLQLNPSKTRPPFRPHAQMPSWRGLWCDAGLHFGQVQNSGTVLSPLSSCLLALASRGRRAAVDSSGLCTDSDRHSL